MNVVFPKGAGNVLHQLKMCLARLSLEPLCQDCLSHCKTVSDRERHTSHEWLVFNNIVVSLISAVSPFHNASCLCEVDETS